jgi:hypothetical protein
MLIIISIVSLLATIALAAFALVTASALDDMAAGLQDTTRRLLDAEARLADAIPACTCMTAHSDVPCKGCAYAELVEPFDPDNCPWDPTDFDVLAADEARFLAEDEIPF